MTVWGPTLVSGRPPPLLIKLAELADWLISFSSTMIGSIPLLAEDFLGLVCKTFNMAELPSSARSRIYRKYRGTLGALLISLTGDVEL